MANDTLSVLQSLLNGIEQLVGVADAADQATVATHFEQARCLVAESLKGGHAA